MMLVFASRKSSSLPFLSNFVSLHTPKALPNSQWETKRKFSSVIDPTLGLTADQVEIQSLVKTFAQKEMLPFAAKWDEEEIFPKDVLRKLGDLGLGAIYCKKEGGGSGLSRVDATVIFETLSTACVSTTAYLSIHNMCAWMIDEFASQPLKQKFLPRMANLEVMGSYCLTEPGSGSDAAGLVSKAKKVGNQWVLNGEKAFISGGGETDVYLIMARTDEHKYKGITCFLVPKDSPGLKFGKKEKKLGWNSQPTRAVIMEDCVISGENVLGEVGQGFSIAMRGLDGGRVNIAACSLGAAQQCVELARDHVSVRKQFNTPLKDFQNTQFKFAQMVTQLVSSRQMVRLAAQKLDDVSPDRSSFCAMAKLFATDNCFNICNTALQMFGGYGFLKDYPIQRYLRDIRVHQILEGTNEVMQMIVARDVLGLK